jgi:hypothetical protein
MKLKAKHQLTGEYGTVKKDEVFEVENPDVAKELVDKGFAARAGAGSERSNRKAAPRESKGSKKKSKVKAKPAPVSSDQFSTSNYRGQDEHGTPQVEPEQ